MKDVAIVVQGRTDLSKEERLAIFEKEIENFSNWLTRAPSPAQQGALTRPERVLLMTYFMQKTEGALDKE